jgi:hypothetical protein
VLPESNYTDEDAAVHSMFFLDEQLRFGTELFLAFSDEPLSSMRKIG